MVPKFKISEWSVNPKCAKDLVDGGYTVAYTDGMVHLTLLQVRRNGQFLRMRIDLNDAAAEELASVLRREDEPKMEPPKKNWWKWNE